MRRIKPLLASLFFALLALAILGRRAVPAEPDSSQTYTWNLPKGFPKPYVPADNPMTASQGGAGQISVLRHSHVG